VNRNYLKRVRRQRVKEYKKGIIAQEWRWTHNVSGATVRNLPTPFHPAKSIKQGGPGVQLGPGGDFGEDLLFGVVARIPEIELIMLLGLPYKFFVNLLNKNIYIPLMYRLDPLIDKIAPKDSGALRESLNESLYMKYKQSSKTQVFELDVDTPYKIVLATERINYARWVNEMPSQWLRHPGLHKKKNMRLYDPDAQHHFYQKLKKEADKSINLGIRKFKNEFRIKVGSVLPRVKVRAGLPTKYNAMSLLKELFIFYKNGKIVRNI